ncbi:putative low-specificity L-threonine aldolase [Neolecta irregularis DAH-3]|uniref:Putative low-specificity L-threonine aldolase n=1 Tax=Neolecta irregularis (strain DAH-3) TaxID=1198029 RepID=A0A1U7LVR7_NEOID|nr:putative low-specificity L-threonine aldolase [Neolecta irregularis DAH-3]|eukprot:OLL26776.1 putative low-specificity L-threonine aldolase [Neolecta irregularis DAH-3]
MLQRRTVASAATRPKLPPTAPRAYFCPRQLPSNQSPAASAMASHDFRSDTVTTPTAEMLAALAQALSHGDDVYHESHATNSFQAFIADLFQKPAALFVASGTMGNQLSLKSLEPRGPYSIICDKRAHVYAWEANGVGLLSSAMLTPVFPENGIHLTLEDIKRGIVLEDIHTAPTKIISLENTLNGTILPIEDLIEISKLAKDHGIKVHLDGARLWNASVASKVSLSEYAKHVDTISVCFSKGLGAPYGSVILGDEETIKMARWYRKAIGGGVRQSGLLAAAARAAYDNIFPTLQRTHEITLALSNYIADLGYELLLPVQTNMILLRYPDFNEIDKEAKKAGIKLGNGRIVMHHQISEDAIDKLKNVLRRCARGGHKGFGGNSAIEIQRTSRIDSVGSGYGSLKRQ